MAKPVRSIPDYLLLNHWKHEEDMINYADVCSIESKHASEAPFALSFNLTHSEGGVLDIFTAHFLPNKSIW